MIENNFDSYVSSYFTQLEIHEYNIQKIIQTTKNCSSYQRVSDAVRQAESI